MRFKWEYLRNYIPPAASHLKAKKPFFFFYFSLNEFLFFNSYVQILISVMRPDRTHSPKNLSIFFSLIWSHTKNDISIIMQNGINFLVKSVHLNFVFLYSHFQISFQEPPQKIEQKDGLIDCKHNFCMIPCLHLEE